MDSSINVSIVPHLYDMSGDHSGMLFLRSVPAIWLCCRGSIRVRPAGRWTAKVSRQRGDHAAGHDDDEDETPPEGIGSTDVPNRRIYCIDFRVRSKPEPFLEEIRGSPTIDGSDGRTDVVDHGGSQCSANWSAT